MGDNEKSSSQWYIFNDFRVTVTSEQEALNFTSTWKTPCILVYAKPETANCDTLMAAPELKNVLISGAARSISNASPLPLRFTPLSGSEPLQAGSLMAIDA